MPEEIEVPIESYTNPFKRKRKSKRKVGIQVALSTAILAVTCRRMFTDGGPSFK